MTTCSTHVLDAARGLPGAGIAVRLLGPGSTSADGDLHGDIHGDLAGGVTDTDGRIRFDTGDARGLAPGAHTLVFATGAWYAAAGRDTLFPEVRVAFDVTSEEEHYHLALLLSPYSYTTYRGS